MRLNNICDVPCIFNVCYIIIPLLSHELWDLSKDLLLEHRKGRRKRHRGNSPSGNPKLKSPAWWCLRRWCCNPTLTSSSILANWWARWACNWRAWISWIGSTSEPSQLVLHWEERAYTPSRFWQTCTAFAPPDRRCELAQSHYRYRFSFYS